ncbi:MAG TPA: tetraacyldisaccharide 4'-kinase [Candidatus Eisenbacteria bacterium]|nr:tetraacyldisaccharide 4'-kinase [Candidatus Eisenbacteria bacterium]
MRRRSRDATGADPAGLRPWIERSWRREPAGGATALLRPAAFLYGIATSIARSRARRRRIALPGVRVVAVGGLTVGGAGKTSLARWAALAAHEAGLAPALLLRGHGGKAANLAPQALPLPRPGDAAAVRWFGDEAMAHRAALPPDVPVIAGRDRWAAARLAASHGARTVILDDGWEQGHLAWDSLWVAIDPLRPLGNGFTLPAGPLRKPPGNLHEANVIVAIAETEDELKPGAVEALAVRFAPGVPLVRFRRRLKWIDRAEEAGGEEDAAHLGPVLLVSSVGSPERLERFLSGEGIEVAEHLAFPDHAPWSTPLIQARAAAHAARGCRVLLVTDKDAARVRLLPELPLGFAVLSTRLVPIDDPAPLRAALGLPPPRPAGGGAATGAMAGPAAIG